MKPTRREKLRYWLEKNKWAIPATLIALPGLLYLFGSLYIMLFVIAVGLVFFHLAVFIVLIIGLGAVLFSLFFLVSRSETSKGKEREKHAIIVRKQEELS